MNRRKDASEAYHEALAREGRYHALREWADMARGLGGVILVAAAFTAAWQFGYVGFFGTLLAGGLVIAAIDFGVRYLERSLESPGSGPMRIASGLTSSRRPRVSWVQLVPGKSRRGDLLFIALAAVMVAATATPAYPTVFSIILLAIIGLALAWVTHKALMKLPLLQRWADAPTLARTNAEALLTYVNGEWWFQWRFEATDQSHVGVIPLNSFDVFEVSTYNDWIATANERQDRNPAFVILVLTPDRGPRCVAMHAGSRSEIAELHHVLTHEFIMKRPFSPDPLPADDISPVRGSGEDNVPSSL